MENYNMETKSELKIIVAELTEEEHKALMHILVSNLTRNQTALTELQFMPIPECTCGKCDKDEHAKLHAEMLESMEKSVVLLAIITEKLK